MLNISSDGWTSSDLSYIWKEADPVMFSRVMAIPDGFTMEGHMTDHCNVVTNTGEYSCLKLTLKLKKVNKV